MALHPASYRAWIARMLKEEDQPDNRFEAIFLWTFSLLIWLVASFGGAWAHRTLFGLGVVLMLLGFASNRAGGIAIRYTRWLETKPGWVIRLIGLGEGAIACSFMIIGFQGW